MLKKNANTKQRTKNKNLVTKNIDSEIATDKTVRISQNKKKKVVQLRRIKQKKVNRQNDSYKERERKKKTEEK